MDYIKADKNGYPQCEKIWEEIPDEDLWEDGELGVSDVKSKILRLLHIGKWKLIRKRGD